MRILKWLYALFNVVPQKQYWECSKKNKELSKELVEYKEENRKLKTFIKELKLELNKRRLANLRKKGGKK